MYEDLRYAVNQLTSLGSEEWNYFTKNIQKKIFKKGEWLIQEGKIERYLTFISQGMVRLYYLKDGKEINVSFRLEKQFVSSYTSFLTQSPSRTYMEALENTTCYLIAYRDLQNAYNLSKNGERLGRLNAELLFAEQENYIASLMLDSAYSRFNRLLKEKKDWLQRVPQKHLASYLNMTPETFSRMKRRSIPK